MALQPNNNKNKTKQKDIVMQKDDNDLLQEDIYYICFKRALVLTKNSYCYYFVIYLQWFATRTHQSATKETEILQEHNIDVQFIITHWLAIINKGMYQGVIITKLNRHRIIWVIKMDLKKNLITQQTLWWE